MSVATKYTELQLKHQTELREKREKIKEEKAKTRRLINRGKLIELLIPGAEEMDEEEFESKLMEILMD